MFRGFRDDRFRHIVFPRQEMRRLAVNLAPGSASVAPLESHNSTWPNEEMEFVAWLFAQAGLDAKHYRSETLHRRVPACLRMLRANSVAGAREILKKSPRLFRAAISAILVGVTSFFRDPLVFEQLKHEIQRDATDLRKGVYVWSIGCSDGAEVYSMAMILAEIGILSESYLLGTDCRTDAIEHARIATVDASASRQIPPEFLARYFVRNGNCFQVSAAVQHSIRWRVASVLGEFETGLWDIIFFRNTAMYLRSESALALWSKLESAIRPGGFLVLGRAERPHGVQRFRAVGPCLYRRQPR